MTKPRTKVIDPTLNVQSLVKAGLLREADLRKMEARHNREIRDLERGHNEALRRAESARIDAIRAVDVAAVQRAAEVAAEAVQTLAAQVPITAEAVRTSLAAALDPILKDVAELRRVQYEQQGQRLAAGETKADRRADTSAVMVAAGLAIAVLTGIVGHFI